MNIKQSGLFVFTASIFMLCFSSQSFAQQSYTCKNSISYLQNEYEVNPQLKVDLDSVLSGLSDLPRDYNFPENKNPWTSTSVDEFFGKIVNFFETWCGFLPEISGSEDNALIYVQYSQWMWYMNQDGVDLVQGRLDSGGVFPQFLQMWLEERGDILNDRESTQYVEEWINDPRIEIEDYVRQKASQYISWNDFFSREITQQEDGVITSRPVTMPERNYVVSAPTDCIMNSIYQPLTKLTETPDYVQPVDNPLRLNTVVPVKDQPISLDKLLGNAPNELKVKFVNGTGMSCILMPNTYHRYNSVVSGDVLYWEIIKTDPFSENTPGVWAFQDFANFVPTNGNVASAGTDFTQFQRYQRAVVINKVVFDSEVVGQTKTGYVAQIPVGLAPVGSVELTNHVKEYRRLIRGNTEVGNFLYGGSLYIILFSEGLTSSYKGLGGAPIRTRMGNQIALLDTGTSPDLLGIFDYSVDVGTPPVAGSSKLVNPITGEYLTSGSGEINGDDGYQDALQFLAAPRPNNVGLLISAKVELEDGDEGCAGVMIRDSTSDNATSAGLCLNSNGDIEYSARTNNGYQGKTGTHSSSYSSVWLRLENHEGVIYYLMSDDGHTWGSVFISDLEFDNLNVQAGLMTTSSGMDSNLSAEFTQVNLSEFSLTNIGLFDSAIDLGSPSKSGNSSHSSGTYTVEGGGNDIWGKHDDGHFLHRHVSDLSTLMITARVNSVEKTHRWAKAGVMIRDSSDPGAKYVMALVRPDGRVSLQWRTHDGSRSYWEGNLLGDFGTPKWVRVTMRDTPRGEMFQAAWSVDGNEWHYSPQKNIDFIDNQMLVGLAVTAHNDNKISTAVFDNVTIDSKSSF